MSGLRALSQLLDPKLKSILDVLVENKGCLFHIKKLSEESGVALATSFRIVSKLARAGFLDIVLVGKIKLYRIKECVPAVDKLVDPKVFRILKVFSEDKEQIFHLKKLSLESRVPLATTFRLVSELAESGFIETVVVGKMKLYKASEKTRRLELRP